MLHKYMADAVHGGRILEHKPQPFHTAAMPHLDVATEGEDPVNNELSSPRSLIYSSLSCPVRNDERSLAPP